jgi:hypothetical protein
MLKDRKPNKMRSILILLFQIILLQDSISQLSDKIFPIDTSTFHASGTINTWFKGGLDDTIITYKRISIDSIICKHNPKECDTVFLVQYYDEGRRYINGELHDIDSREQQYGFLFKNKRNGLWDFTGSPSCFSNGTLAIKNYYYYNDVLLPGFFIDKYYFLNDTINGFIFSDESNIGSITDSILYTCRIFENDSYVCDISLGNGLFISQVLLVDLKDELDLILSGYYNREIVTKINKHNR